MSVPGVMNLFEGHFSIYFNGSTQNVTKSKFLN